MAGLVIEDTAEAEHFLRHLNYYRFSGYPRKNPYPGPPSCIRKGYWDNCGRENLPGKTRVPPSEDTVFTNQAGIV